MPKPDIFPCAKCGECCRHIDLIPQLVQFDRGDGSCIYLRGNLCAIYESRPEICRVDKMYDIYFSEIYPKTVFYQLNLKVCHRFQREKSLREAKAKI